jgi:hypothetical protein
MTVFFGSVPWMSVAFQPTPSVGFRGANTFIATFKFPNVALRPHVRNFGFHERNRASASSTCTPRLPPINSCHSSTTTHRRSAKRSRVSAWLSIRQRLSGVVTRAVGRCVFCFVLIEALVSPVRVCTVHGSAKSSIGFNNDWAVSWASARNGVIHSNRRGTTSFFFHSACSFSHSSTGPSHTASVLPVPVAECTRPSRPSK